MAHFDEEEIKFDHFAYRWVTCFLTREFTLHQTLRIWDTYLSEENGFSQFHCYMCAALLLQFSKQIKEMAFQEAILLL